MSGKAKTLSVGPDGRNVYTADTDARAGHRSATSSRPAGAYVGRELHIGVGVPALHATDTTTWVRFGPEVPAVIVTVDLVPAGTNPADAVRDSLLAAASDNLCHDVVFDPGYSLKRPERLLFPLREAGIDITLRPAATQASRPYVLGEGVVVNGQLFSAHVPDDLITLRLPNRNSDKAERDRITEQFERLAAYRYGRVKAPGADGTTRWENPLHAGRIRSREFPRSMRGSTTAPLIALRAGIGPGARTITVGADQLPLTQPTIVGTRAWNEAYGRRNQVESVNASLHGDFIEINKGYVRSLDNSRIDVLLSHGLAGLNRRIVKQWMRIRRLLDPDHPDALPPEPAARRRPRRDRRARYEDLTPRSTSPPG